VANAMLEQADVITVVEGMIGIIRKCADCDKPKGRNSR
jgi:hypothetical protein